MVNREGHSLFEVISRH